MPFFPRIGFYLPVVSKGNSGQKAVALTFDDGPDPLTTPMLLDLLEEYDVAATFFVTGKRTLDYPHLVTMILQKGHTLGNHSHSHDCFVMFKGIRRVAAEIQSAQAALQGFGPRPLIFRPPAGITYPGLALILKQMNLYVVNFSCRAFDRGNRRITKVARRILKKVKADDIIMLHDLAPPDRERCRDWLAQVEQILSGLNERGLAVKPLAEVILKPVAETAVPGGQRRTTMQ